MSDFFIGLGIIICPIWWVVSLYVKKWKTDNPGKPVFEWVEPTTRNTALDSDFEDKSPIFTSDLANDKWLSPGGITTDYYSYSSQRDEDSR